MKVEKTHYGQQAMNNYKNLKNHLQQNIVRKVKGMIKEHKKEQSL